MRDKRNQLSQSSLFQQERRGDSQRVIANRLARQQALCNRRKKQGGCQRVPYGPCLLSSTTVQSQECNDNSTRSYENQSVHRDVDTRMQSCIKAYQNCFKHCYNCETIEI